MRQSDIREIVAQLPFLREQDLENNAFIRFLFTKVFSIDHKVIARQYLYTGIFWALLGGLFSLLIRIQLGFPELDLSWLKPLMGKWIIDGKIDQEFYLSVVTLHGSIMIFFVLTSGVTGTLANFLIPLQIGARDMASGFINMLSYWLFFLSGVIMLYSVFVSTGAASGGWTSYPPLSALPQAAMGSRDGVTLWILSMIIFIISNVLSSLNFISTIINMRTIGMTFRRLPLTIWAFLVTSVLGLLSFPVLLSALILLFLDRTFHTSFFLSDIFIAGQAFDSAGGSPLLFQHLFWFLGHPEVYIAIFPAFGVVSEVVSTYSRKPIFGYAGMVTAMIAIMLLSFTVWAHHMFVSGMDPFLGSVFSLTSFIIAVPSSVKVFNWLSTLWRGNIVFSPAMLFAIGMISFFITGGLTGIFVASPPIDMYVHDTYFIVAHFHFVMGSSAVFGFLAGLYHWYPKIFGRMLNEKLSYIHFWATFAGIYLIFFPMHFIGMAGVPRRYYAFTYFETFDKFADLNALISIFAFITFAAQLIFIFNFLYSKYWGKKAEQNPSNSNTLEWTTPVIIPMENWEGDLPVVYRWPYDYSVPGTDTDFIPQNVPNKEVKE